MKKLLLQLLLTGSLLAMDSAMGAIPAPHDSQKDQMTVVQMNGTTAGVKGNVVFLEVGKDCSLDDAQLVARYCEDAKLDDAGMKQVRAEGLYNLGLCLCYGTGVKQDQRLGYCLIKLAAVEGHAMAMFDTYMCLHNGLGVARDVERGYQWFCRYKKAIGRKHESVSAFSPRS